MTVDPCMQGRRGTRVFREPWLMMQMLMVLPQDDAAEDGVAVGVEVVEGGICLERRGYGSTILPARRCL